MPFDNRPQAALAALARERDAFRTAIATTLDQVRTLAGSAAPHEQLVDRAAVQLGSFAIGRVDSHRFGELFAAANGIGHEWLSALRHTQHLLEATLMLGDDAFCIVLPDGADLRDAVNSWLAGLGRVFAAAHAVLSIRAGTYEPNTQEPLISPLPPDRWTRGERAIAPPLVIELEGADLRVGGLEEVLQGAQKIVLLVNGPCPPAALVRLISPSAYVQQCRSIDELREFSAFEGPGIAAVMTDGAQFSSVPTESGMPHLELNAAVPETRHRVGHITAFQQNDELRWLQQLAVALEQPAASPAVAAETSTTEPGDQLAAWLLKQAQL